MSIPTPAPVTPPGDQGVPVVQILPGSSVVVIEGDFSTYNERPKAVAAEVTITTTTASTITLDNAPYVLRCDCTAGNMAVTLPPANSCIGRIVWLAKVDSGSHHVDIYVQTGDTLWRPSHFTTLKNTHTCCSFIACSDGTSPGWQVLSFS
jgi:hypothetical protein